MKVVAVCLIDDTVTEIHFKGAWISTQLFARDQSDHRGCRAVIKVYSEKGRCVRTWHAANVLSIDRRGNKYDRRTR
jgi:hypothetical protein